MKTLFDGVRLSMEEAISQTAKSLNTYFDLFDHVAIAFSGGKDSSAVLTLVLHLIETGRVERPKKISVYYADTRQELPPLHFSAMNLLAKAREYGCETNIVLPPVEKRFWPYILGVGVPSPNNGTLRWCTRQIKVDPMKAALNKLGECSDTLMLTGVRIGESAARDQRIAVSCSKDGGECGQGYFQAFNNPPTLAPILHWRVCHVWDWLVIADIKHGFGTYPIAEAYGMTESIESGDEPINARTGCIGCPLVSTEDTALSRIVSNPKWAYLAPLKRIKGIHEQARDRNNRKRKRGGETKADGSLVKNQGRFGPIKLEVREQLLGELLSIQAQVNTAAQSLGRPEVSLINQEEEDFIRRCIAGRVYPQKWSDSDADGDDWIDEPLSNGDIQPLLFGANGKAVL
jgi:DNA sulfur modification protein DndC